MKQEGKLNPEQFALAMWLIQRKQAGKDPPAALTPDMVPPSMRPSQDAVSFSFESFLKISRASILTTILNVTIFLRWSNVDYICTQINDILGVTIVSDQEYG